MDEREYNNINQVSKLFDDILDAICSCDVDRLREIKGRMSAIKSIVTALEFSFGMQIAAIKEYQRKTREFDISEEEEMDQKKRKT